MPMTTVVTRDVPARFRGFLASVMLEIAPGVYVAPKQTKAVRERVWKVLSEWYDASGQGALVMTWRDNNQPGQLAIQNLGDPPKKIVDLDGVLLVQHE